MDVQVKASFKQATVKGDIAVAQMEVRSDETGFNDLIRLAGKDVFLTVEPTQQQIDI